jgi:hypothetical protein
MQMFSINAASLLLERDRRTLTKAMAGVVADGRERNQPRWKMSTIVDALTAHGRANNNGHNDNCAPRPPEYAAFDAAFTALEKLPTVERRRRAAVALMPRLHAMIAALGRQGASTGEHPDHTSLRSSEVYRLSMIGFQSPCQWSHDEVWHHLNSVGFDEDGEPIS